MHLSKRQDEHRTVWIITYTPAADEPRVVRQASTLQAAGWSIVVCGYEGRNPVPDDWNFLALKNDGLVTGIAAERMHLARTIGHRIARSANGRRLPSEIASKLYYGGLPNWHRDRIAILEHAERNPSLAPDLVIAHDYPSCPPADGLRRRFGAKMLVDSHEYMLAANPENAQWNDLVRPVVRVMQDYYFSVADQVITVSPGIVDRLNAEQRLKRPAKLIRSLPLYEEQPFRPVAGPPTILYHGLIDPVRNLDLAVRAAALWTTDAQMIMRGPADPDYIAGLRTLAAELGCEKKIRFEPPVPFRDLISAANMADIGYFVYLGGTPQRDFALPNKFFEYCMAGLALMVSDLPAMSQLTRQFGIGTVLSDLSPQSIATAVDGLTEDRINGFKRASLEAAKTLCWQEEERELLEIIGAICGPQ